MSLALLMTMLKGLAVFIILTSSVAQAIRPGTISGVGTPFARHAVALISTNPDPAKSGVKAWQTCSGVIIWKGAETFVVETAAHCMQRPLGQDLRVKLVASDLSPVQEHTDEFRHAFEVIDRAMPDDVIDPKLMKESTIEAIVRFVRRDSALLLVKGTLPATHDAISKAVIDPQKNVVGAGFGLRDTTNFGSSRVLRLNEMKPIKAWSTVDGTTLAGYTMKALDNELLCVGDSGGPVFQVQNGELRLVGNIAGIFGIDCGISAIVRPPGSEDSWYTNAITRWTQN